MSASTSSELPRLPANRSSYAQHPAATAPAASVSLFTRIGDFFRRQAALDEMAALTDRELADIGIARADIDHVFDNDFAAARHR